MFWNNFNSLLEHLENKKKSSIGKTGISKWNVLCSYFLVVFTNNIVLSVDRLTPLSTFHLWNEMLIKSLYLIHCYFTHFLCDLFCFIIDHFTFSAISGQTSLNGFSLFLYLHFEKSLKYTLTIVMLLSVILFNFISLKVCRWFTVKNTGIVFYLIVSVLYRYTIMRGWNLFSLSDGVHSRGVLFHCIQIHVRTQLFNYVFKLLLKYIFLRTRTS